MLAIDPDSLTAALGRLEPGGRALLDLSLRRGLEDAEIADFLGTSPEEVADRRARVIEQLARDAGATTSEEVREVRAALVDLEPAGWGVARPRSEPAEPEPEPEEEDEPELEEEEAEPEAEEQPEEPEPEEEPEPARQTLTERADEVRQKEPRRGMLAAGIAALISLGVLVAVLAVAAGKDDDGGTPSTASGSTTVRTAAKSTETTSPPKVVRLRVLGKKGSGTAQIDGDRLKIKVKGLPEPHGGNYEIWLYNGIEEAEPLASFDRTSIDLDARLPSDTKNFRFIDVSFEPKDGNPNHSGQSVLRVPIASL